MYELTAAPFDFYETAELRKSLVMTQNVLNEALLQNFEENAKALNVMKELEEVSLKLDAELPRYLQRCKKKLPFSIAEYIHALMITWC